MVTTECHHDLQVVLDAVSAWGTEHVLGSGISRFISTRHSVAQGQVPLGIPCRFSHRCSFLGITEHEQLPSSKSNARHCVPPVFCGRQAAVTRQPTKTGPKFHKKTSREREKKRMKMGTGEGKKARNFGRSGGGGRSEAGRSKEEGGVHWLKPAKPRRVAKLAQIGLARPKSGWPPKIRRPCQGNAGGQSWPNLVPPDLKRPK